MNNKKLVLGALFMAINTTGCSAMNLSCANKSLNDAYQNKQANMLVEAAAKGDVEVINKLVSQGADVNYLDTESVPMLLWTICAGNKKGFETLLKAGANPNIGGSGEGYGSGLGDGLSSSGSLVEKGWSATVMAASTPDIEFLRLALKYGGDPDAHHGVNSDAKPLVVAAANGFFDHVKLLVKSGANVNVHHDKYEGNTAPVKAIAITGRYDIAYWLVEQGYSYNLERLARTADARHVSLDSPRQQWKEKLINLLRDKGLSFPANPGLKDEISLRIIPKEDIEDIIFGRKFPSDYPLKQRKRYHWESKEEYEENIKKEKAEGNSKEG